jgi:GNAT superfamily N-acetyltransferase
MSKLPDSGIKEDVKTLLIRDLSQEDIPNVVEAFNSINWDKPAALFEQYVTEAEIGGRLIWMAHIDNKFAGYLTLKWKSLYQSFSDQTIPEIMDLNVLPSFRNMGVGSMLLDTAEAAAASKSDTVGIGVGLYAGEDGGYGAAQRLYVKRGYIPDGRGVTYNYRTITPGNSYSIDDNLILWLTKKLK